MIFFHLFINATKKFSIKINPIKQSKQKSLKIFLKMDHSHTEMEVTDSEAVLTRTDHNKFLSLPLKMLFFKITNKINSTGTQLLSDEDFCKFLASQTFEVAAGLLLLITFINKSLKHRKGKF